ncbi:MAG: quinolinate synthase [Deltaproteobacteria bacterium]|nr:MAG: quinolinate synthase [Deltaproteobacteria bacterium]
MKEKIKKLAREKNAIILAHNYEPAEIQDIADLCGDSLELSIKASETNADIIVFCGVHFMAETAKILSFHKKVLLPNPESGCPMADMVKPEDLLKKKAELNNIPVITYVNSSAAVKAISDICCTSANVVEIVNNIESDEVLMTPDKNLARFAASHTNKKIHLWEGYCPFHNSMTKKDAIDAKEKNKNAVLIAHPECPPEVLEVADEIASTSGMIKIAKKSRFKEFIIATEAGHIYPLQKACPDKIFHLASEKIYCEDMKKISLEQILYSLESGYGEIFVPEDIRNNALKSVEKMLGKK